MENIQTDIDNTIRDASDMNNGGENAASSLMRDVESAKQKYGNGTQEFGSYINGVTAELIDSDLLPELALGYASNNFDNLDLDGEGGLSKVELYIAAQEAKDPLEKALLSKMIDGFKEVKQAHESNQLIPFVGDEKGITDEDIETMLRRGDAGRDAVTERSEKGKESSFVDQIARDLRADDGKMFLKLARGNRDSDRRTIEKDDLEDWLEKDDKARKYDSSFLSDRERQISSYLMENWDSDAVKSLRDSELSWDSEGNEFIHEGEGDMTLASIGLSAAQTSGARVEIQPQQEAEQKLEKKVIQSQEKAPAQQPRLVQERGSELEPQKPEVSRAPVQEVKPVEQPVQQPPATRATPRLTDAQIQANTEAYLRGDHLPKSVRKPAHVHKVHDVEQHIHIYPQNDRRFNPPVNQGQCRDVRTNCQIDPRFDQRYNQRFDPYNGMSKSDYYRWKNNQQRLQRQYGRGPLYGRRGGPVFFPNNGQRQAGRSSDIIQGGRDGVTFGHDRAYERERYGSPSYSGTPPYANSDRGWNSGNSFGDIISGVERLSRAAEQWLAWDIAKQHAKNGSRGRGRNRRWR